MTTKTENKKNHSKGKMLCEYKREINECYSIKDEIYEKMNFTEIKKVRMVTKLIINLINGLEKFLAKVEKRKV